MSCSLPWSNWYVPISYFKWYVSIKKAKHAFHVWFPLLLQWIDRCLGIQLAEYLSVLYSFGFSPIPILMNCFWMGTLTQLDFIVMRHTYSVVSCLPGGRSPLLSGFWLFRMRPVPWNYALYQYIIGARWRGHHCGSMDSLNETRKGHDALVSLPWSSCYAQTSSFKGCLSNLKADSSSRMVFIPAPMDW